MPGYLDTCALSQLLDILAFANRNVGLPSRDSRRRHWNERPAALIRAATASPWPLA